MMLLAVLTAAAQKLIIEKATVDVGRTGYQQPITAVFEFRVKGSKKVRINDVRPDCNCTKVEYPKTDQGDKFQTCCSTIASWSSTTSTVATSRYNSYIFITVAPRSVSPTSCTCRPT